MISTAKVARDDDALAAIKVTAIVNCAGKVSPNVESLKIHFKDAKTTSSQADLQEKIEQAADFIDTKLENGETVCVQCLAGVSRSPAIVVAFLVLKRGMSIDHAVERVKQARPGARVNNAVLDVLRKISESL